MRTMMDFEFDTKKVQNTHFHQDLEILYVLDGGLEIQIESEKYELGKGDFLLINANKRHSIRETEEELLTASFRINFSMLAEYLGHHMKRVQAVNGTRERQMQSIRI